MTNSGRDEVETLEELCVCLCGVGGGGDKSH